MGKIFTLDAGIKNTIQDALDDLITELGKECRLVYPPKWTPCDNCVWSAIGQKSSNHWKHGGPMQFPTGTTCPMCNGAGRRAEEVSETFTFSCEFNPAKFYVPMPKINIRVPFSHCQTKCYLTQVPKILKCDHMVLQVDIEGIVRMKYKLMGMPSDQSNIIQGRYAVAMWEQIA